MVATSTREVLKAQVSAWCLLAVQSSICRAVFISYLCTIRVGFYLGSGKAELNAAHRSLVFGVWKLWY